MCSWAWLLSARASSRRSPAASSTAIASAALRSAAARSPAHHCIRDSQRRSVPSARWSPSDRRSPTASRWAAIVASAVPIV